MIVGIYKLNMGRRSSYSDEIMLACMGQAVHTGTVQFHS